MSHVQASELFRWLPSQWKSRGKQKTKQRVHLVRPLHWFLLVWVSLVYLWGLWGLLSPQILDPAFSKCWNLASQYGVSQIIRCPSPRFLAPQHLDLWPVTVFTVLVLFYGALLWHGRDGSVRRHWLWFSFLLQAGTVFVIGLIVRQEWC